MEAGHAVLGVLALLCSYTNPVFAAVHSCINHISFQLFDSSDAVEDSVVEDCSDVSVSLLRHVVCKVVATNNPTFVSIMS